MDQPLKAIGCTAPRLSLLILDVSSAAMGKFRIISAIAHSSLYRHRNLLDVAPVEKLRRSGGRGCRNPWRKGGASRTTPFWSNSSGSNSLDEIPRQFVR